MENRSNADALIIAGAWLIAIGGALLAISLTLSFSKDNEDGCQTIHSQINILKNGLNKLEKRINN